MATLVLTLILSLPGCAVIKSESGGESDHGGSSAASPPPKWMTTRDALGVKTPIPAVGNAAEQLSKEPVQLANQLEAHCRTSQQVFGKADLTTLISALYRDAVDPAVATEALVRADCGSVSEIVEGMVSAGGEPVVAAVVTRALLLSKPGSKWTIETAAASGLERKAAGVDPAETEDTGPGDNLSANHARSEAPPSQESTAASDAPGGKEPIPADAARAQPGRTDPARLTNQLAERCGKARQLHGRVELTALINELYRDGVEPTVATRALIKGDCGSVPLIVQGIVAEGGEPVRAAVVEQALPLAEPGTKWMIESAAEAGLAGDAPVADSSATGNSPNVLNYVMGFFGTGTSETDDEFVVPYGAGIPGYGIYTFILLGGGSVQSGELDWDRYRELLRVVQGYVLADRAETPDSELQRHVFVVPVRPDLLGESLEEQTVHALSVQMRDALALYFDQAGRTDISDALRHHTGPLLVSSLEPSLIPSGPVSARMVTDLSDIGPEYLYAVIDAYDHPIPEALIGRIQSFDPIHQRLSALFTIVEESATGRQQQGPPSIQIFRTKSRQGQRPTASSKLAPSIIAP